MEDAQLDSQLSKMELEEEIKELREEFKGDDENPSPEESYVSDDEGGISLPPKQPQPEPRPGMQEP